MIVRQMVEIIGKLSADYFGAGIMQSQQDGGAGRGGVGVPPVPDFIRPLRDGRLRWDGRSREVALDSLLPTHALKKGAWMGHPPLLAGREWAGLGLCLPTLRQEKGKGWGTHLCWRVESGMV